MIRNVTTLCLLFVASQTMADSRSELLYIPPRSSVQFLLPHLPDHPGLFVPDETYSEVKDANERFSEYQAALRSGSYGRAMELSNLLSSDFSHSKYVQADRVRLNIYLERESIATDILIALRHDFIKARFVIEALLFDGLIRAVDEFVMKKSIRIHLEETRSLLKSLKTPPEKERLMESLLLRPIEIGLLHRLGGKLGRASAASKLQEEIAYLESLPQTDEVAQGLAFYRRFGNWRPRKAPKPSDCDFSL